MKNSNTSASAVPEPDTSARSTVIAAVVFGLISAVGYTAANVCLRSVTHIDPIWVSCIKSMPTVLLAGPWVAWRRWNGHTLFPSRRLLLLVIAIALLGQLGGNISFQYALGKIGIALDVPLTLGTMIVVSAVLGRWLLGDTISAQMAFAGFVLIVAMFVLGWGADEANRAIESASSMANTSATLSSAENTSSVIAPPAAANRWNTVLGVTAAGFAGFAYCCLSLTIRFVTRHGALPSTVVATVGVAGLISLFLLTLVRCGVAPIVTASRWDYAYMAGAGIFNYLAFITLTKALQISSVFFVNALNASQTAMAAMAGIVIFGEPASTTLGAGIALTIIGLLLMTKRTKPIASGRSG